MPDMVEIGRERLALMRQAPTMAQQIVKLQSDLAECRGGGFNTQQYRDLQRRCCDECNRNGILNKMVGDLKAENAELRRRLEMAERPGGGYPPPARKLLLLEGE